MEKIWDEYQVYSSDEINYLDNQVKLNLSQPKQEESMSNILIAGGGGRGHGRRGVRGRKRMPGPSV